MTKQGRKFKVYDRARTQSVNVCTSRNVDGEYEQVFYFRGLFRTTLEELDGLADLPTVIKYLRKRSYDQFQ